MKRKNYWFLFAILLLSLTSLSQGQNMTPDNSSSEERKTMSWNPQPSSPQDSDDQPIRVITHLNESDYKELLDINDNFIRETGIQVEIKNIPDTDAYRQLTAALEVGEGPDVMLVNSPWIRSLASSGYILPAESYQSSTTGSDVISPILQMLEWNGYQWGIPLDMDPYVLVWQAHALQTIGIPEIPQAGKEWKDLLVKQENRKDKKLIALPAGDAYAFAALMGVMGTDPGNPTNEGLESLSKLRPGIQFIETGKMQEAWTSLKDEGLVMIAMSASSAAKERKGNGMLELRLPEQLYADNPFLLRGRSYAVSAQVQHPQNAADWIAYMTSDKSQRLWSDTTGYLPVLKEMYQEDQFQWLQQPVHLDRLLKPTDGGTEASALQSKWDVFSKAAKLLLTGKSTEQEYREALEGRPKEKTSNE
ncbi:extracellular solute-binding protein [Paenibacillus dokdonensis]|uniref:Extracellular solute-binding protein n=1 Tax=Paenibacillus dokdonensis TaxID=2567944 RepID=A0ABU6GUV3_9BACL|nr:extracellular solute-binding protein [Paenibacillus dokdonensis]MEC0243008.1 extracellular solute-binding protein [Paenibacillus dokdonensis]